MGTRFNQLADQYFDNAGDPLVDGFIAFKESGTDTDKTTYADINLTIANANPVPLNANGVPPNIFFDGTAKAILYSNSLVQIRQIDPVSGSGSATSSRAFPLWDSVTTYSKGSIVYASDGCNYQCVVTTSQGDDPTSSPAAWEKLLIPGEWNSNQTYGANDLAVRGQTLYVSKINANSNNDPATDDGTNWISNKVYMTEVISSATNAISGVGYIIDTTLTLTLPASPNIGEQIEFSNRSGTATPVIARGGNNIMGLAEDMTLDDVNARGAIRYSNASEGWVLI